MEKGAALTAARPYTTVLPVKPQFAYASTAFPVPLPKLVSVPDFDRSLMTHSRTLNLPTCALSLFAL